MQQMVVKGKNIEVTKPLRQHVEEKLGRLDRHLDRITSMTVELSSEPTKAAEDRQVVQVTMLVNGTILRAEESSSDMFAAVDAVVDKLQRRVIRYKEKLYHRSHIRRRRRDEARILTASARSAGAETGEDASPIVRTKRFPIKPMSAEEAVEQMELLGHDFYVFYNESSAGVNIVYKRDDGTYGLLIPEMA